MYIYNVTSHIIETFSERLALRKIILATFRASTNAKQLVVLVISLLNCIESYDTSE